MKMKNLTVEMQIINNHYHDNDMVFMFDGKIFCCLTALAEHLGGEYLDLDNNLWRYVKFVFNNRKISYDEVIEY